MESVGTQRERQTVLEELIRTLRDELTQYGELLALLEQQLELIVSRSAEGLFENLAAINAQIPVVAAAREKRDALRKELAAALGLSTTASFRLLTQSAPADYRPLLEALVTEINDLLRRSQQRLRQNHILLRRSLDSMQQMITSLFPTAIGRTYNQAGAIKQSDTSQSSIYELLA